MTFGFLLLILGCAAAWFNHPFSGMIAIAISGLAVVYDAYGKHHSFLGPLNMGMCRGGNLLLGISAVPYIVPHVWYLAVIPVIYIAAITMISRGEVNGGNPKTLYAAALLYFSVMIAQLYVAYHVKQLFFISALLLIAFALFIFVPLIKAMKNPIGPNIGKAVKAGVISLILMDAAWCMAFGNIQLGWITMALLPVSVLFAKFFAVT